MEIVVFITCGREKEARTIARGLVEKRLAACVNMIPGIVSVFSWKGRIERCRETLLVAKSTKARFRAVEKFVRAAHSYEVPEIIALPLACGNRDYLEWLNAAVR